MVTIPVSFQVEGGGLPVVEHTGRVNPQPRWDVVLPFLSGLSCLGLGDSDLKHWVSVCITHRQNSKWKTDPVQLQTHFSYTEYETFGRTFGDIRRKSKYIKLTWEIGAVSSSESQT